MAHRVLTRGGETGRGPTATRVLRQLASDDVSAEENRCLVIEAEAIAFPKRQKPELCRRLWSFIERFRDSQVPDDLVAVGSAIRKLVMNISYDDLESLAPLLDAGHRASVPLEIELEVSKTVMRKLSADPPHTDDSFPQLADRLRDIAQSYLNDRLLPREKYAATAIDALLALCLMRSRHVGPVAQLLKAIRLTWFTVLVAREARRISDELLLRFPPRDARPLVAGLKRIAEPTTAQAG